MLRPEHVTASELAHQRQSSRRTVSIAAVGLLHVVLIYALASGLASNMVAHITEDVQVAVIKEKMETAKPPPPPPPDFKVPPPDFVPPPEISIQTDAPTTNAITTVQHVAPTPPVAAPPPKPQGVTAPASIGAPHQCTQAKWYPSTAVRLNQEGTTTLAFTIGTDGGVKNVTVSQSSGFSSLDDAAVRCVASAWHYKPAMENGQAVEVPWKANVKWQLQGH